MATIQEKLADSLHELQRFQQENNHTIIKSSDLSRVHLVRLVDNGFLQEVMKGWYIFSRPDSAPGDTTNWYTSFWQFISMYAQSRFENDWCLTPEQSLVLHSGNITVPTQAIIRSPKGTNNVRNLLHNTSLLDIKTSIGNPIIKEVQFGLNLYTLAEALIECSPDFFRLDNISARTCLSLLPDASNILSILLEKGNATKAGRLAGAFRNIGNTAIADEIMNTMKSIGYVVREVDPFTDMAAIAYTRPSSPYVVRLKLMWNSMREGVLANFPKITKVSIDIETYMKHLDEQYKLDAYHSLSIEGYKVTNDLIEKVRSGTWEPENNISDIELRNAMAARGYWQAFQAVKESVVKVIEGGNAGDIVDDDHRTWYRELFSPSVVAGLLKPADLAGYRVQQVYISGSMHTPLNPDAVRDAMPVLFDLLRNEPEASVRAVLGHFFFVYIHPYMDGNGRIARFLMNTQLISGGYNWTIIPVERRAEYMDALEKASVQGDITDFALFIASLIPAVFEQENEE
ncbi:MAG: Fic family protein [Paludibacter sp.]|nr:Fic family protein [Paludibacter sp.]